MESDEPNDETGIVPEKKKPVKKLSVEETFVKEGEE